MRENGQHGSHIAVVLKFHVGEQDASISADRRTSILNIGHPSCIVAVKTTVELAQLVLKILQCNINMDLEKIRFSVVAVDCSQVLVHF
ncbi:hypothetical protein A2U01_0047235 [Trifolium medium]|uniref:Uncharacterized protein n=1 Tax=Trifolium medium TaxID=97028 RepID=A0A392QQD0_9FABA|nr:hypothetical protein [Trifolium medium]